MKLCMKKIKWRKATLMEVPFVRYLLDVEIKIAQKKLRQLHTQTSRQGTFSNFIQLAIQSVRYLVAGTWSCTYHTLIPR